MIRSEALGELKDGAAGLVTLSELLASRRVGPRAIAAALSPAAEACAGVAAAAEALAREVSEAVKDHAAAAAEVTAVFERAVTGVRALEAEVATSKRDPADARTRLVLERAANTATSHVAAGLFIAEMFAAASTPRTVSIRVADVLGFGPALADGPAVIRATLDVPPDAVATTDARLLRALVELSVQIVALAGVESPHVQVSGGASGGARVRVGAASTGGGVGGVGAGGGGARGGTAAGGAGTSTGPKRASAKSAPRDLPVLAVRRLPWSAQVRELAHAAGAMMGVRISLDPSGSVLTAVFG